MRARTIIRQCLGLSLCAPAPLYMMFDGSYVPKWLGIAPPGTTYDSLCRVVGNNCEFKGPHDRSTATYASLEPVFSKALRESRSHGSASIVDHASLAPEVFKCFLHHACQPRHVPCITVATIAKVARGQG